MIVLLLTACVAGGDSVDSCDGAVTWDNFAAGFFAGRCEACHGAGAPDRHGAPASVTFDSEQEVLDQLDAVRGSIYERQTMPPAGGLTEAELDRLAEWLDCPG